MTEAQMLKVIHKVYPKWEPTAKSKEKRYGQIKALYNRSLYLLKRVNYQMKMRLYEPDRKYEQLKMEGF